LNHVNLFSVRRAVPAFEESTHSDSFVEARKPASCVTRSVRSHDQYKNKKCTRTGLLFH
jgi:hypothetical protein